MTETQTKVKKKDLKDNLSDIIKDIVMGKNVENMDKNTRGLSDKDVEMAWESLENEPFTTSDSGEQVLDDENGWFGFSKGTTQQEIWRWFDTHHSKGVAYLVNDFEPEETQPLSQTVNLSTSDSVSVNDFLKFRDTILKGSIKENPSPFQTVDFSRNNFNRLFPWLRVETPIESVKFGEGQFAKFSFKERRNLLAAVYETLVIPDIIIEEERFNEFNEPATSHNYAKNFIMDLNSKMIQSVVVEIENSNIIITSHERPVNEILNKIKKADQILYLAPEVGLLVRQKAQNGQSMADQNLSGVLQGKTSFLNKAYNYNETKSINYMLNEKLLTNNEVLRYSKPIGLAAAERINTVLTNDGKRELEPSIHKNDTLEEIMRCIGDSYNLPEEATKKRRKIAIQTLNRAHIVFEKYSEYLERKDKARTEELNMAGEENVRTISWDDIQENADGAHWNDEVLAVKNKAREQAVAFANEIGAELNADDEDDIESFVKDYGINFLPDGTMSENRYILTSGNPQSGHNYGVQAMLSKFLEEESEKNASDNRGKEFASNFSRERFADGDLRTIIQYANHLDDGSAQWMLGAKAGGEWQLYYRDPTQFGEWQKATAQEFFDFVGDFYAHNYDAKNELDENSLSLMRQLFPNSNDIEKLWKQNFTKNDMQPDDLKNLSDHSAHEEIWSHLPDIEDDHDSPTITLENAIIEAENYLENHADELNDEYFGKRSDSTEEEKNIRNEFLSLLKNVNDALHSDEFLDSSFLIDNATAENLDLLHAEVLKVCAELAKEDFLSSFGEIIDGEYPNQEEVEYRRQTLNDLRGDMKNLDNYLDDNASRLLENIYETARHKSLWLFDFIEATVDTSDPGDEHMMEWNRALEELLDGYTDYKDFNEKWDVSLTPTIAKFHWLESEKDLIHIAFNNAFGNDSVEVPYGAESYKDFLDSIDFEKRFSLSNLLRAETLQMNNEKSQGKNIAENKDIERFSAVFAGMEAPDLLGEPKDIEGLIENYKNTNGVKLPVVEAISTMLYDSPQIHENGSSANFGALSMENFDDRYKKDGKEARNELCDMVAEKIVADKSVKSFEQVKELLKIDSEKILKEKLEEITHSEEFVSKFGDWEKANRIEKLKKSESLQISSKIIIQGKDETSYINELRSNPSRENLRKLTNIVSDFGKEMLQNLRFEQNLGSYASPVLTINDDGKKYHINFSGIKETSHHNLFQKGHIEGIYNIPQIVESALYLTTEKNEDKRKPELKQFHYYALGIKLDNDDYTAKIVFTENKNGEIYYDQSLSTIEKGKLIDLIQQKNKPTAVNPINRRDSNELSENEPPSTYYDRRLVSICQVPQMPYLEMVNGKWRPKQEAIKAVEDGKVFLEKNGQIYVMHDESFLEEKIMEKEERKLSKEEFERLSNLLGTATDSEGQDFKAKFNAKNQDTKQIVATLLHETRESEEAYALSPSYFDFESEEKDGDGYDMRWNLYENIAEKIISDKTITNMEQVENLIEEESFHLEEEYNKEHNITQNQEYQKEERLEQEWPGLATWKELADVVGKDIYVYKDDVLENNKGISEKEWKTEALARTLNDGILDLRGFDTESTSKINSLQYDSDFMKSIKGEVYKAINPEKWDVLEKVAEDTVDEYSPEITELTVDTLQIRYDEKLSEDHVYLEAVEKGLVEIDRNMAERILKNNNPHLLEDGVKIAIVKASFEKDTPEWEKPERFIVTPHDTLPDNYTDEELAAYLTDNRINSTEPKISEKQASIISYYFMRNDYALYIDQKGNLNCVDFSEDFNTEDIDVMTNKDLLLLTEDLIDKDIGFKDRAEEDLKEIQNVLKGYEKGQSVQKTQSPQELYDSFIGKVEKEFKELKLLRVATKNTIKTLSPEDKKIINEELKKRGAKTPESLALVVKKSIEKRNKNKTRKQSQNKEKDYFERER